MPIEFLEGGEESTPENQVPGQTEKKESGERWEDTFLRNIVRLPFAGAAGIGDIVNNFYKDLSQQSPGFKSVSHHFEPAITTEKQHKVPYLKPKETKIAGIKPEKILDMIASDIPIMLATGGLTPTRALGSVGANTAINAAQEHGVGPLGQFFAGLGGSSLASGNLFKIINKSPQLLPKKLRNWAEGQAKKDYKLAEKAGNYTTDASGLDLELNDLLRETKSKLKTPWQKEVVKHLSDATNDIQGDKINVNKAWDRAKEFKNLLHNYTTNRDATKYYKRILNSYTKWLDEVGNVNPKFGIPYKQGNDLWAGLKAKSSLTQLLQKDPDLNKLARSPKVSDIVKLITHPTIGRGTHAYDLIRNSKMVRNYLWDLSKKAVEGDREGVANILRNIKDETIEDSGSPSRIQILEGGEI